MDSITCPICNKTSYHPDDIAQGYCGFCHDWTGETPAGVKIVNELRGKKLVGMYPTHDYDEDLADPPYFKHRPTHPDFYRIAGVVKANDSRVDRGGEDRAGIYDTIQVDVESLGYVAKQRALRALDLLKDSPVEEQMIMLWMDAFCAGQRFEQVRDISQPRLQHGNRRQRRSR